MTGSVLAVIALMVLGWAGSLLIVPWTSCGRCSGSGKNRWSSSSRWGPCGACSGSGRRLRTGATMWKQNRGKR